MVAWMFGLLSATNNTEFTFWLAKNAQSGCFINFLTIYILFSITKIRGQKSRCVFSQKYKVNIIIIFQLNFKVIYDQSVRKFICRRKSPVSEEMFSETFQLHAVSKVKKLRLCSKEAVWWLQSFKESNSLGFIWKIVCK